MFLNLRKNTIFNANPVPLVRIVICARNVARDASASTVACGDLKGTIQLFSSRIPCESCCHEIRLSNAVSSCYVSHIKIGFRSFLDNHMQYIDQS